MPSTLNLAVIGGDGIGPEVTTEAIATLRAAVGSEVDITTTDYDLGAAHFLATGEVLSYETLDKLSRHDAIVLGGFTRLWARPVDRLHLNGDGNRFSHAVELFHIGKVRRIVFVSGVKTSTSPFLSEAELAARTAVRFGVPAEAVVALNTSLNTGENASECLAYY